jgi:hypothetical protein
MYRPGSVTLPTCAQVTLLTARLLSLSQGRCRRASAEAYLSPLRQTTFFHSGLCRWKAELVRFSVDCRHRTAEIGSYFIRRPIGHQEPPKCFLFVVSPTIGISRQERTSLLCLQPEIDLTADFIVFATIWPNPREPACARLQALRVPAATATFDLCG